LTYQAPQPPVPYATPQSPYAGAPAGSPLGEPPGPLEGDIWESEEVTVRTRPGHGGGVVIVASVCAMVVVIAVVVALALLRPTPEAPTAQGTDSPSPTATVDPTPTPPPAPTGLRIVRDDGGAATLTWTDPSDGQVPFVISAGRQGDALMAVSTVAAGETTATIYGLNINYDYCFTVAAVWSSEQLSESERTCTRRTTVTPPPA
jgi:hypothetical protein